MSKTIMKQGIEGSLGYFAKGEIGVSSPMSKTRSKQGIEEKRYDSSNVSKTILKQGIDVARNYIFTLILEMLWSETGYFGLLGNKHGLYIILLYLIER